MLRIRQLLFFWLIVVGVALYSACVWSQESEPQVLIRENSFQTDCPLIRSGRPFQIKAVVENEGGLPYQCQLVVPPSIHLTNGQVFPDKHGFESTHIWDAICNTPGQLEMSLKLLLDGREVTETTITQKVLPARPIEKQDYIPAPNPVKTQILVGAHNCPLWERDRADLWNQVVKKHQERTPALGIYSQDNPEIADWETKWAVEHGVDFFIYCWYRTSQGGPITTMFEQSIFDDALFQSRFGDQMRFTIMWENQRRDIAGIADMTDLTENLLPYWIEKFFKRSNYLKVDNKPVLFVYRPEEVATDLGGDEQAKIAFDVMREACREAGFAGLTILGEYRGTDPAVLTRYKEMGLDYTFAYCWYVHYPNDSQTIIDTQLGYIEKTQQMREILPQVITLSQAWSGWKDEGSIWKLPPTDFEILLRKGKEFIETRIPADELGGQMVILDNWNEWSEGHYIAPYREYGFDYLDAVRRVFTNAPEEHEDLIPQDIGLGPYDLPSSFFDNCTSWKYHGDDYANWKRIFSEPQDWKIMMGLKDLKIDGKCLVVESTTGDSALLVYQEKTIAAQFNKLRIRMRTSVTKDDMLEFYWKRDDSPQFSNENSVKMAVHPSNDFIDYELPLAPLGGWKGRITELRLDPVCTPGIKIEIESITLVE